VVNTTVTGKAQASVVGLADGGRVVVRGSRSIYSNLAALLANAVVRSAAAIGNPNAHGASAISFNVIGRIRDNTLPELAGHLSLLVRHRWPALPNHAARRASNLRRLLP